jgi:hypothetical protein
MAGREAKACRRGRARTASAPAPFLVSEDELLQLARAFERGRGRQPTMAELGQIDAWATQTRTNAVLLPMVLKGLLLLDLDGEGAPVFRTADDEPTLTGP